ncbi:MAG: M23 family metallopeptidase, partial [Gammaproteobacteria bacterium]
VESPPPLADTETERAVESEVTETTDQASTLETVSDAKALIDPLEESIETNSAPAQRLVEDIEINGLRDQESELDLLSQQLEKISADSLFHENEIERLKRHNMGKKTFLFSLFVLISSVNFSAWSPSDVLPTFAHQRFAVDLSHPALQRVGPMKSTEGVPQIRATQRHYLHTVGDSVLSLQWPLPDRKAGEGVQYGLASNALYLESSPYTPVLSIAPGQVVFSGPSAGQFGVMVIVQHRDELLSVYGYLHDTWVDPGQMVRSGQVIARVGESQWSDPRLYFEMRYQGRSEDPYLYFSS